MIAKPARTRLRQVPGRPGYTYVQLPAEEVTRSHRRFVNLPLLHPPQRRPLAPLGVEVYIRCVTCSYCGRAWPLGQVKCWDKVVGCGASLELHCASL